MTTAIHLLLGGSIVATSIAISPVASAAPVEMEIEDDDEPDATPPADTTPTGDTPTTDTKPTTGDAPASDAKPTSAQPWTKVPGGVEPPPEAPPEPEAPPVAAASADEVAALREQLAALQARVDAIPTPDNKTARKPPRSRDAHLTDPPPSSVGFGRPLGTDDWGLRFSGYVQVQYQRNQLSEDQLQQGGVALNRDRFMVRRGRARVNGDWQYFAFELELDASTTRGPFVGVRQAHLDVLWRNEDLKKPPLIMASAGLTEVPFGYEVRLGQRDMPFLERSTGSLALFPGPVDVGLRLRGGVGPMRYDFAMMNGTPLDDRAGGPAGIDFNRRPDFAGRVGLEALPKTWSIGAGASFLAGTGFHAGQDATKNVLQWQDLNENGSLDSGETLAIPGTAAVPSENFKRWAVGVDLQVGYKSKIGWSRVLAEAAISTNLDRGLFISDPVATGSNLRQITAYAAYVQDITRWALLGFRYDIYDANADLLDQRRGIYVPANGAMHTMSPLVGAVLPTGIVRGFRGRFVIQYDVTRDHLGRDARGVPGDLKNNQLSFRVQGEF